MKLTELAPTSTTKQVSRVFESYFEQQVNFDKLSKSQSRVMLNRVRGIIKEHRNSPQFHVSERNPAYLKLVMMEQALVQHIKEADGQPQTNQQAAAMQAAQIQQKKKQINELIKQKQNEIRELQKQAMNPTLAVTMEGRRLTESEVQQAQVVLAAQDMVDSVQGMIEDATEMQFKELPALVDQIKNQVGPDQAAQFNNDASAALSAIVQSLQGSKQQLDTALGVVTGQAPAPGGAPIPGADLGAEPDADLGADLTVPAPDEEVDVDAEIEEPNVAPRAALGRERR